MALQRVSRLTVGTGGVGKVGDPGQLNVIRRVMDENGIWMHCGNYGEGSFKNLKIAFGERPAQVPRTIFKLDGVTAEGFRTTLRDFLAQTGLERTDIGQICGFPLSKEPDAVLEAMTEAQRRGTVDSFIMDLVPAYCDKVPDYIRRRLFDGYIFYYNVLECHANDTVLSLLEQHKTPIFAMRVFAGGEFFRGGAPQHEALDALFKKSGCRDKVEFCLRFSLSVPSSVTAIAGTSQMAHLERLLDAGRAFQPLDPEIVIQIRSTLRRA